MQATRFWVLACLGAIASAATFSCGSDEATKPSHTGSGGEAGEAGAPSFPIAGSGANTNGGSSAGGEPSGDAPGSAGAGGFMTTPGASGEGGGLGFAGSGGVPTVDGEQLGLCARLSGLVVHADNVGRAYSNAAYADCRITWVIPLGAPLYDFRNQLVAWSLDLWGCPGRLPVDTFALVYETPTLSPGDITLLVEHYMTAAQNELDLSPAEFDEMEAALERLAAPLVSGTSTEPSNSQCVEASGGAGGAAAGGAGGTAGIAGDPGVPGVGGAL